MSYPISMIRYANVGPFRVLGAPSGCFFVENTPRESAVALSEGSVLAAIVPVGSLKDLGNEVECLGRYGIAARGEVESVTFSSNKPFEQMTSQTSIYLTSHSASSVRLLYLLLGYSNGFDNLPRLAASKTRADGKLLIGDAALLQLEGLSTYRVDLAAEWFNRTKRPFVFARWVVRKDAPARFKQIMTDWLKEFTSRQDELLQLAGEVEAARLGVTKTRMLSYLNKIRLVLEDDEIAGQVLFLDELAKFERTPLFRQG